MSSRQEIDFAALSESLEQTMSTAGVSTAFITIAIGYLITVLTTPPELTPVNFLIFTLLQVLYCAVLWWLARKHLSDRLVALAVVVLSILAVATVWLGLTGLQWDWLLYLVTISVYFMAFSLRTAIIAGVLLYLSMVVNDGFLDQWQWSHIYPSLLSLLSAYAFVAVFSLVLRKLSIQKERAETLLHQLEASNAELEEAHRQLQKYASEFNWKLSANCRSVILLAQSLKSPKRVAWLRSPCKKCAMPSQPCAPQVSRRSP